jgi:hypothetical protein
MADNKIQIKRSATNAVIPSLSTGELAFTGVSNTLWIGAPDGSANIRIGGQQVPGTLTANQALVANNTSWLDAIKVANATLEKVYANGGFGSVGQALVSGGGVNNVYWTDVSGASVPGGSNTEVQFNDSTTLQGNSAFTFNKSSNTLTVQNNISAGSLTITGALKANTTVGSAGDVLYSNGSVAYWAAAPASSSVSGSNTYIQFNNSGTMGSNSRLTFISDQNFGTLSIGNSIVNSTINSTSFSGLAANASAVGGNTASDLRGYSDTQAGAAYTNAMADTLSRNGSYTGNSTFGGTNTVFNSNAVFAGKIISNFIPAADSTYTLGNSSLKWASLYVAGNTIFIGNSSISVDSSNSITIGGSNTIVANTVKANTITAADGATITINSNVTISAANVQINSGQLNVRDVVVAGNLTVSGTLTSIDTTTLTVKDANIRLANGNSTTDTTDIGWYGVSGNSSATYYSGMVRKHDSVGASLTSPIFTLFSSTTEPTGVVDATAGGYNKGTLNSYLNSSALIANSTVTNITANSTVSVALVANTLSLSTALAATYGGTGQTGYTVGDILYASTTTALSKLGVPGTVANGQVLQITNNLPAYGTLDGGTF